MSNFFNPYMLGNDLYLMQEKAATVEPKFRDDVFQLVEHAAMYDEDDASEELERQVEERTKEIKEEEKATRLGMAEDMDCTLKKRLTEGDYRMVKRIIESVFRQYGVGDPFPEKKTTKKAKKALDKKTVKG